MADLVQYYGTGRRKSAIARVFLRPGTGEWKVNGKAFEVYFVTEQQRVAAKRTLALVELASSFDVVTTVRSGGVSRMKERKKYGQKGARARFQFSKR
jgi:small subunit ribosomal protein S9